MKIRQWFIGGKRDQDRSSVNESLFGSGLGVLWLKQEQNRYKLTWGLLVALDIFLMNILRWMTLMN